MTNTNRLVWAEIPVSNLETAKTFYEAVLDAEVTISTDMGPAPIGMIAYAGSPNASAHLYEGKPSASGTGNTVHLAVAEPLDAVMEKVTAAGGAVKSPAIPIPVGTFFYAEDPDGNSVGLFNVAA